MQGLQMGADGERRRGAGKKPPKKSAAREAGTRTADGYFALKEYAGEMAGIKQAAISLPANTNIEALNTGITPLQVNAIATGATECIWAAEAKVGNRP